MAVATMARPDGLRRCIDAVLAGRLLPAEILVVDQGDHSSTRLLLRRYSTAPVPVRHLAQARLGLAASRNAALRGAVGAIVAVTDDDCRPEAGWLHAIAAAFAARPDLVGVAGRVLPDGPEAAGSPISLRSARRRMLFTRPVEPWRVGTGGNFAVRRREALEGGGYDERLGVGTPGRAAEDLEIIYRLLRAGGQVLYEPRAVVLHARAPARRRWATRWGYGVGVGALCGLWMRRKDRFVVYLLKQWVRMRVRLLVEAARQGNPRVALEEPVVLGGTIVGIAYGLTRRRDGARPAGPDS